MEQETLQHIIKYAETLEFSIL